MTWQRDPSGPERSPEGARRVLRECDEAGARIDMARAHRYGRTVLLGVVAQIVLCLGLGFFAAGRWAWDTIALFVAIALCLSYFQTRAEAGDRKVIPHGCARPERFASNWNKAVGLLAVVVFGVGGSVAGMPGAWGRPEVGGMGWWAIAGGVLAAVAAVPRLVFAVRLLRG